MKRHQIQLDDVPDADVLAHVDATNALIEAALARGEGVLVHCQAGQSESASHIYPRGHSEQQNLKTSYRQERHTCRCVPHVLA